MPVDEAKVRAFVDAEFEATVVPALSEYIRVPNQSPLFDAEWATNGLLDRAMDVLVQWVDKQAVPGLKYSLHKDDGRTPFLCIEVEATAPPPAGKADQPLLMYAHMDKQPPMTPFWSDGLGPWEPVIRDG
jgi:acetylornithine deacetylase/succinyl-diaminopimelate desuccinylase-like protein